MEFDEIVVKETPGLCRCCLSEGCYKDLSTEYTWMEEQEIYADMLLECFDISISQHMEGPNGPNRLICEVCITRLRDACNFKKQVLDSEKKFVDMVGRGEFKAKVIAYEPMKSEMSELAPVVETEVEYLEDDMEYDDENKDDPEPTISEEITVTSLPVKGKRGRPKKTVAKPEKKKPRAEEKPKTKIAKDCNIQPVSSGLSATQRQNLQKFFTTTGVIPFECNGGLSCFFCGKHISQHGDLKKHTKSHDYSTITFSINKFSSDLTSQIINVDVTEVNCETCDIAFDEFGSLIDHMTTSHDLKDITAFIDIRKFRLIDIRCLECDKVFINYLVLERHIHEMHETSMKGFYSRRNNVTKKINPKTTENSLKNKEKYSLDCPKCFKVLTSKLGYQLHLNKCGLKNSPAVVSERNLTPFKIRQNIASVISMSTAMPFKFFKNHFRCFYCSKDYADFDVLKDHTFTDHSNFNDESNVMKRIKTKEVTVKIDILNLTCKLCFENLVDLSDLINHLTSIHGANYDKSIECLQPFRIVKDNIHCPLCPDTVFRYFKKLLEHMNEVHTDNNIVCAHCGLTFRGHPNHRAHISRYHRTRACKCPDCNMEFWNLEKLARHRANVHGTKKFKCPQCVEKFVTNYMMKRHQIAAHGFGHKCQYCNKLFTRNSHMRNHVRRLHFKEKNIECNVCKEKFFDRALLNVHMVKHIGERNYHCDVCGKKFLWKKNLRGHMVSHERDEGPHETTSVRRRKNLETLFNNTTIMPFKWRGKYQCFYCSISFVEYPEFLRHTKSHGLCSTSDNSLKLIKGNHVELKIDISEILCEVCYEPFTNLNEIIDHLIGKHDLEYDKTVDIPFQEYRLADRRCHLCGQQFPYFANLITHFNITHPKNSFICGNCGLNYNKERDLAYHLRNYHKHGGYRCEECSEIFPNSVLLTGHKKKFHFRRCNLCDARFPSYTLLQKHKERDHSDNGSQTLCHYCSKQCKSTPCLIQHLRKCKMKTLSKPAFPEETMQPKKKRDITQVRKNIQCVLNMSTAIPFRFFSRFSCFHCSKHFVEFDDLKSHVVSEHPVCDLKDKSMMKCKGERITVKIDISGLSCKVCHKRLDNLDALIDHLISKHDAPYDKSITECFDAFKIIKDNIPCNICPNVFRYFSSLLRHINSEHSNNNKICDYCGRSFKHVANLNMHITNTHTGACECDVCGAKYRNQWCLGRHKAKTHNAKVIQCPECDERFQSHYHKQKHMIKAHEIGHKCTYCGKMFTRNSFMKDHIRRTHLKEKNVPCSVCNEKFFDNYLLKLHMVKHKGERNFSCEICGKAFLRRSNLNSHKELHKKYEHLC